MIIQPILELPLDFKKRYSNRKMNLAEAMSEITELRQKLIACEKELEAYRAGFINGTRSGWEQDVRVHAPGDCFIGDAKDTEDDVGIYEHPKM